MGRAMKFLSHHSMQFLQFEHEIVFRVQPAGCIHDQISRIAREGGRHGVVSHRRRVRLVRPGNHWNMQPLAPKL